MLGFSRVFRPAMTQLLLSSTRATPRAYFGIDIVKDKQKGDETVYFNKKDRNGF